MKACFMQAAVIVIYYLGVQNVMTADIESVELKDVYFKLKEYIDSIKDLGTEKIHVEELLAYVFRYDDKPFRDEVMRLEKLYAAKWIYDLFKNINPNDANLLQTYSENYERLSDIKTNSGLDDYSYSLIESAIKKKWDARLDFDLATNIYLNMKTSSKSSSLTENNGKSLDERKSTLQQTEKQYKESKLRVMNIYQEVLETGQSFKKVYDAVEMDVSKLNPQLKEMQENIDEMAEQLEIDTQNLKATEAEAKNTLNSNDRKHLEHFAEDLKQKIDDYKRRINESKKELFKTSNNLIFANPEVIAEKDNNQHAAMKYFSALDNHLKILTNMEVQRIDVLELLSLEERIKIYESIMQEEINSI
ncbi:hypothetical protein MS3_00000424 [Schistosoma haematobium]|uniref:Uncharacterized protein n=1 Tax=Schistosoma haematobium TaxID=6185 RepID=A0A922LTW7_SCHHA|nr:hypothetical protein MS3_00000424 [Schistosoma haematobium]KAH9593633.1 hypothetical protein MS3_00000424 [Schistosoma haematobium]CAH8429525.1 unnamed protein product [Schistosoma haematobium]